VHAEHITATRSDVAREANRLSVDPPADTTSDALAAVPAAAFAAHAALVIRADGFRSRVQARRDRLPASADAALASMNGARARPQPGDRALAEAALHWGRALPHLKQTLTDFERDASRAAHCRRVGRREQGLISALIAAYRRQRARSRHLGTPGATLALTVLVEAVTDRPSQRYPRLRRLDLLDANANRLTWWQTTPGPLHAGHVVALRGRVRRHTRVGRTAVTVLSGCQAQSPDVAGTERVFP
jgi:hypothetical protein